MKADTSCLQGKMTVTLQNSENRQSAGSPFSPWTGGLLAEAANCLPSSIFSSAGGLMENLVSPPSDADHTCTAQKTLNLDSNPEMKTFSSPRNSIFSTKKRIQYQYLQVQTQILATLTRRPKMQIIVNNVQINKGQ